VEDIPSCISCHRIHVFEYQTQAHGLAIPYIIVMGNFCPKQEGLCSPHSQLMISFITKEIDKKKIIKMIDEIIKQQKNTDIRFQRNKEQCFIEGETQLVVKYLIADVQQRWESEALVENILDHLDTYAYSNKELSQILDTDKQQFPENSIS
jgi:hypothetical protein